MGKNKTIVLLTALSLGTTWAIRGQFGHEQGAAWAGAVACIILVYSSANPNWTKVGLKASLMGAIGWGIGGMMSYGIVVGYGRSEDWANATYGLLMLGLIGGLYGLLGGGLFGLGIEEGNSGKKVAWHQLLVEMTAGAIIFYFFIVEQLGIYMTPPRSEAWAICAGAGLALLYFLVRNSYSGALRTALFSAIGAGFGFAFGNFLQVMGFLSKIHFNFWNVMEYSLGFFGGLGMSYGLLTGFKTTSPSPIHQEFPVNSRIKWSMIALVGLIPLIVFHQSFLEKDLLPSFSGLELSNPGFWAAFATLFAFSLWGLMQFMGYWNYKKLRIKAIRDDQFLYRTGMMLFLTYMAFSILITGAFISLDRIEQYLYVLNFLIIAILISKLNTTVEEGALPTFSVASVGAIVLLAVLIAGAIAAFSHGPIPGGQMRF